MQLLPAIGRLRARQPGGSQSGKGKTCEAEQQTPDETPDENPDENLTPFLEQLQKVEELAPPLIEGRSDVCPPWEYAERDIPLCSSGNPRDEKFIPGDLGIILRNAIACKSLLELETRFTINSGGSIGAVNSYHNPPSRCTRRC